ncbi:MAG: LuxR C-terminal-related transcriptional regulator [Marinobacter sp.]|nr:LuxR C-terminal-related transcriptional regulator [Marinobacter sp.]
MKVFDEGNAANDEYLSLAGGAQAGELIWDLLKHRIKRPKLSRQAIRREQGLVRLRRYLGRDQHDATASETRVEPTAEVSHASDHHPGAEHRATLIHIEAPAGFGKSQLLAEVLADEPESSISWLSLAAQDNDPSRFLALLMLAFGQPERRHQSASRPVSGSATDALALMLASLHSEGSSTERFTLVLDNVDELVTVPSIALLDQLLRDSPPITLILLSRRPLPVQTHAFSLDGCYHRLAPDHLALTRAETLALFDAELAQEKLTVHAAEHLHALTEGWLTPLALYRQSLQSGEHDRLPILDTNTVRRFLQDTLFQKLTPPQQRSLCQMAEFDIISDDLFLHCADSACDPGFSPSVAADAGLPLFPVPGRNRWYRFNPLAREWLRARGVSGQQVRAGLASRWFEERGDFSEALRYALGSGDVDHALTIASESSEAMLVSQDTASLLTLRRSLPAELIQRSSRLRVVYSWVHAVSGQFREARQLIDDLSPEEVDALSGRVQALRAFILRGEGVVDEALEQAELALAEPGLNLHARLMALLVRSSALCASGQFAEARSANRYASRLARESGDGNCEILAVYDHARIQLGKGYLKRSEQLLKHGLDTAITDPVRPHRIGEVRLQLSLALVLWHQGRWDEADRLLVHCVRYSEQTRDLSWLMSMALRALIAKARGRVDEAFAWVGQAERMMHKWLVDDSVYEPVLEALKISFWLTRKQYGSIGPALARLQTYRERALIPELFPMLPGQLDSLKIRYDLATGQLQSASDTLSQLREKKATSAFGSQLYVELLGAVACQQAGKADKAQARLKTAIDQASEEHYLSPFVELKLELLPLIKTLLPALPITAFVTDLRELFGLPDRASQATVANANTAGALAEPISDREQSVLELIAMGLSNQDIADKLHISLHTVKTHARRINAKLNVRSRTQAIVRARELGLL